MGKTILVVRALFALMPMFAIADEWRFSSKWPGPAGGTLFLSESLSTTKGCEGKLNASEQILALGKWKYIRSLCYEVNKSAMVQFVDPEKIRFFNTFDMAADWFTQILTKKELAEAADREESDRRIRSMNENTRMLNEEISRRQIRNDETRRQQSQRRPTICNHIGDMSICN